MPRVKWNWDEIVRAVKLRHDGKTFLEIAQNFTDRKLEALIPEDPETLQGLQSINANRKQKQIHTLVDEMVERFPHLESKREALADCIVSTQRMQLLSKRNEWKQVESEYQKAFIQASIKDK